MRVIAKKNYYSIIVDEAKNRLYLSIVGHWSSPADVPDYINDIKKALNFLDEDFTILTDLTKFEIPSETVEKMHVEVQRLINEAGLLKAAEIFPEGRVAEKETTNQIAKESGIEKGIFSNRLVAEAWLDEK